MLSCIFPVYSRMFLFTRVTSFAIMALFIRIPDRGDEATAPLKGNVAFLGIVQELLVFCTLCITGGNGTLAGVV